jgi:CubicO group peptidase (beta-lactamase class C family)
MSGFCDEKFSKVEEKFERNFTERGDIGASFACTINGEIVRRITGQTIGTFFRENVATPLDADFHIGLDPAIFNQASDLHQDPSSPVGGALSMDPESMTGKVFGSVNLPPECVNSAAWRQAEIPAANGHGNAQQLEPSLGSLFRKILEI